MTATKKPFFVHPPWNILFEFHKLEKMIPWQINIQYLLSTFIEKMQEEGQTDFRASGLALGSSAFIYLMKSKLLLKLEEAPRPPKNQQELFLPPFFLPLRHELTSTTIKHLLEVLDEVLKTEKLIRPEQVLAKPILPSAQEILPQLDGFLMEMELQMENFYAILSEQVKGRGIIKFSIFIQNNEKIDVIRKFILLLFLAQDGKITLWQNEETKEIYITIGEIRSARNDAI